MELYNGDCLEVLKSFSENSIDSLITDPPAGISFMGKSWDDDKGGRDHWIKWLSEVMKECLRVLKPGAHGLVWSIPRTSHWTAMALEDAGFEVRDCITHLFGSGFPKSLDVSKAIDKMYGAEREVIGKDMSKWRDAHNYQGGKYNKMRSIDYESKCTITAPSTPDAKQWQGFGTALKPAAEFWWLVRKPLEEKTVAKNVLKYGTGGLNIDASRIGTEDNTGRVSGKSAMFSERDLQNIKTKSHVQGRFPANLILDEEAGKLLDDQSGVLSPGAFPQKSRESSNKCMSGKNYERVRPERINTGSGGASRFFYCAKVSSSERNAGLEHLPKKKMDIGDQRPSGGSWERGGRKPTLRQNTHPTVKPIKLMSYLTKLITPPNGIVLDPFMGSGSTGIAAKKENFKFIGIEKEKEYFEISQARLNDIKNKV